MMGATHTPGPWSTAPGDQTGFKTHSGRPGVYAPARPSDDYFVLKVAELDGNVPASEVDANARLIAAAPDMLEALRDILSTSGQRIHGRPTPAQWARAQAAVAKAEGIA